MFVKREITSTYKHFLIIHVNLFNSFEQQLLLNLILLNER